ncbi:MAG: hypothetical protein JWN64_854 [Parcubacteria group bacterium]|nr:hypothetical protein [Parcubacteria group bacterium]
MHLSRIRNIAPWILGLGSLFVVFLFIFINIVEDVVTSDRIVGIDVSIAKAIASMRTPALTKFFLFVTELGSTTSMLLIIAVITISYVFFAKKRYVLPFLVTALGSTASVNIIKQLIARDRPDISIAFYAEKLFSFPSGHSASSLAIFGFVAYVWVKRTHSTAVRILIVCLSVLLILAIGLSRLYLGVHYLSDVLGGYVLGILWLIIGISLVELRTKTKVS